MPLATPVKTLLVWNVPPLRLYSIPAPPKLLTVITAFPAPREQSTVWVGTVGVGGCALIVKLVDGTEEHPCWFVTVNDHVPAGIPVAV